MFHMQVCTAGPTIAERSASSSSTTREPRDVSGERVPGDHARLRQPRLPQPRSAQHLQRLRRLREAVPSTEVSDSKSCCE